jgi:hypothetical protein
MSAVNDVNRVNDVNDVRKTRRRRRRDSRNAAAGGLPPKTPPKAAGFGVLTSLTRLTSLT